MAQVYYTMMRDQLVSYPVFLSEGKMLKFTLRGDYVGEFPVDVRLSGLQAVDVVSILVSGGNIEIALNVDTYFAKSGTLLNLADIALRLHRLQGQVFSCSREVGTGNDKYTQYIYAYLNGVVTPSIFA